MPTYITKREISDAITAAHTDSDLEQVYAFNAVFINNDVNLDSRYRAKMVQLKKDKKKQIVS